MGVLEKNMQMLQITGFWIDKNKPRGYVYYIQQGFVANMAIYAIYGVFYGMPMYMYKYAKNFSEISEGLGNIVGACQAATIYLTLVLRNDELKELVQLMRNIDESYPPTNEHTRAIYEKTKKLCWFWSVTFPRTSFTLFALMCFVATIDVIQKREVEHRLKFIYPFDPNQPGYFEFAAVTFLSNFFFGVFMTIGCNLMILCMFINAVGQLRILNYKIANLRSTAEAEVRDRGAGTVGENVTSMEENEIPTDKSLVEIELGDESEIFQNSASSQQDSDDMTASEGGYESLEEMKIQFKMKDLLKDCIAHHCELVIFIRAFEEHWSAFFFMNVAVCMAHSVLILTSTAMKDGNANLFIQFGIIATFYSMLGIFCYLSQQVTVETELLQESVYGCGWIKSSKSFKKSIGIMVSFTNQPIVITAAGFVPMSMDTFNNVLNSAYSYYMVLSSF